jgi:hypothetical protein
LAVASGATFYVENILEKIYNWGAAAARRRMSNEKINVK